MTEPGAGRREEDHSVLLLLCYFGIFSLVPYLACSHRRSQPKMDFVFRHARQGLALAILVMISSVVLLFANVFLAGLSEWGALVSRVVWGLFIALAAAASLAGWIRAFSGKPWVLPVGGRLAERWL